jgi:hypothetical protein
MRGGAAAPCTEPLTYTSAATCTRAAARDERLHIRSQRKEHEDARKESVGYIYIYPPSSVVVYTQGRESGGWLINKLAGESPSLSLRSMSRLVRSVRSLTAQPNVQPHLSLSGCALMMRACVAGGGCTPARIYISGYMRGGGLMRMQYSRSPAGARCRAPCG